VRAALLMVDRPSGMTASWCAMKVGIARSLNWQRFLGANCLMRTMESHDCTLEGPVICSRHFTVWRSGVGAGESEVHGASGGVAGEV